MTRKLIAHYAAGPRPPTGSTTLDQLTDREREVLIEVARGLSNGEIAGRLFLSEHTVKTHLKRIFTKLGLRGRAQAVVLAYEGSLVQPQDPGPH